MSESEVIKIVRDHIERQFPMKCSMCEHRFLTLKDYLEYTTHLGKPVSYDAEKGDWQPHEPLGTLSYANCRCGTTDHQQPWNGTLHHVAAVALGEKGILEPENERE